MNNSKKLLALLMALAMLVTFAVPTFAAGETPPAQVDPNKEYSIEFKFSDDITHLKPEELKVVNAQSTWGDGLKTAKAGAKLKVHPKSGYYGLDEYRYSYYVDGKKLEAGQFTMPAHDVTIYVALASKKAKNFIVSKATSQPTGWVIVTVDAGEHGGFIPQPRRQGTQPYKTETFYANPLYEVEIIKEN